MTRQGRSFNDHLDSYEGSLSKRERRIYEERRARFAVANLIIERRKALGMTQDELAETTGVSQPEISRIERGATNPTVGTVVRLAKGLNARFDLVEDARDVPTRVAT